jgi:nitrogenase molybdenum-iron protein alpha/beta subunit
MAKKGFVKNTVKGKQRGKPYSEGMKTTCLAELLTQDIHKVAKKHGIPESTLRGWLKKAKEESGDEWAAARRAAIQSVSTLAAAGAHMAVQQAVDALDKNEDAVQEHERLIAVLKSETASSAEKQAAQERLGLVRPMSDYQRIAYIRALTAATQKAEQMTGETVAPEVKVVMSEELEKYGK